MALTKEQLKARLAGKLISKEIPKIVWGTVVSAVGAATPEIKTTIVDGIKLNNYAAIGMTIVTLVRNKIKVDVENSLDSMLADNRLTVDELGEILE